MAIINDNYFLLIFLIIFFLFMKLDFCINRQSFQYFIYLGDVVTGQDSLDRLLVLMSIMKKSVLDIFRI